jgi:hypothetical protein
MLAHNSDVGSIIGQCLALKSHAKIFPRRRGWDTSTTKDIDDGNRCGTRNGGKGGHNIWIRHIREARADFFYVGAVKNVAPSQIEMIPESA